MGKEVWIIFTILFAILSIIHFILAVRKLPKYYSKDITVSQIKGVPTGVPELMNAFNNHIDKMDASNKKGNLIAAVGYLLACATCIVSYFAT